MQNAPGRLRRETFMVLSLRANIENSAMKTSPEMISVLPPARVKAYICVILIMLAGFLPAALEAEALKMKIGCIGSLSGYAGSYGQAVLEGAQLAVAELNRQGSQIELISEDDQSVMKNTVTAYKKLVKMDGVRFILGGSWWLNAVVRMSEQDDIPLVSCETLYNQETVPAPNYFLLAGDLAQWVRVYEPLVQRRSWKKAAVLRFVSGFGATLAGEMERIFSGPGRSYLGAIEYADIEMTEAAALLLQIRKLSPDVLYVD